MNALHQKSNNHNFTNHFCIWIRFNRNHDKKCIFAGVTGRHHSYLIWTGKFIWFPAFICQWRYQFIHNDMKALSHHTTLKEIQMFQKKNTRSSSPYALCTGIKKRFFSTINERLVTVYVIDKNGIYHFDLFSCGIFRN